MISTIQVSAPELARSTQPQLHEQPDQAAKNSPISATPTMPIDWIVARTNTIHAISERQSRDHLERGHVAGKSFANQWR